MAKHRIPESERYKGPSKWVQYIFARGLISLLQMLPITISFRLGRGVGWLCYRLLKKRRLVVCQNLTVVNEWVKGQPNDDLMVDYLRLTLNQQAMEVFQRAGANLFAGFSFSRMPPERISRHITVEGMDQLKHALADDGQGAIVLLAHMGPWEALTQLPSLLVQFGITAPFGAMYRPLNNHYLEHWFRCQRESKGARLFSRRDGLHKPVDFLRAGGMLGILADQKLRKGAQVPFFGRASRSNPLPGILQRRTHVPMLSASISSRNDCCWCIRFSVVSLDCSDAEERGREVDTAHCNQALERVLGDSILDGFWFHNRF
ncbi:lysophospholipid acyltransferase family protein [Coraliomargarita sp. SDUM461003]|uniref:Lysophospholipid acyltransferase family protein n=1 Tax=Thalassobacterium maritimum TaxID=3041265 RepID=A0ABU1AYF8_9BACT|nr:lysophospholipid acyltransferase family protein [Coraliomargarita sp. SDUM461003]MDQ8209170.1 lysophospholipid acyltransferase family protein [Coraliomargarita sp. SDUM461003]